MPDFTAIRAAKPTTCTAPTEIGPVRVTYDRNAFVGSITAVTTPRRLRLSRVLLGWDVTNEGAAWQPHDASDLDHWEGVVRADRATLRAERDRQISARAALTPEAAGKLPTLFADPPADDAPVTWEERRNAYALAWRGLLDQLPPDFITALDDGVLDDFLGAKPPMRGTATG